MGYRRDTTQRGWRKTAGGLGAPTLSRNLSWKDHASIGFSAVALGLSGLGTYFNFFRDETRVEATLLSSYFETPRLSLAVMNKGNRQVALTDGSLYAQGKGGVTIFQLTEQPDFPILIEPGKMTILTFNTDFWDPPLIYQMMGDHSSDYSDEFTYGARLSAIGATGARLQATMDAFTLKAPILGGELGGVRQAYDVHYNPVVFDEALLPSGQTGRTVVQSARTPE